MPETTKRAAKKAVRKAARDPELTQRRGKTSTKATKINAQERKKADDAAGKKKSKHVQIRNPVSERYIKVETRTGRIVAEKRTAGPYRGVPVR